MNDIGLSVDDTGLSVDDTGLSIDDTGLSVDVTRWPIAVLGTPLVRPLASCDGTIYCNYRQLTVLQSSALSGLSSRSSRQNNCTVSMLPREEVEMRGCGERGQWLSRAASSRRAWRMASACCTRSSSSLESPAPSSRCFLFSCSS